MLTNLRSVLVESGYFGYSAEIKFKIYQKEGGSIFFSRISEWKSFTEDEAYHILSIVYDTDREHPFVCEIYADMGDKQLHLKTAQGGCAQSIRLVYSRSPFIEHIMPESHEPIKVMGSMPAGCHL